VGVICECDDPAEVDAHRREYGITFPIHLDTDFRLAEVLDATITPEVLQGRPPLPAHSVPEVPQSRPGRPL